MDWEPGDIALCIRDRGYCGGKMPELTKGRFYTVAQVGKGVGAGKEIVVALLLVEVRPMSAFSGYDGRWFTKFKPEDDSVTRAEKKPVKV